MNTTGIRPIQPPDVPAVARLLETLARKSITCEFSPSAQEKFLLSNNEASIRGFIGSGFRYWVAEKDKSIVGFVGIRDNSHLYHLFVSESEQRQGLARKLWHVAMAACREAGNTGRFTVNSSNNAVPVYESLGGVRTKPTQN
jgi:ribosomal protein S18 acetylase RimI-like enzyme